jgi:carbonic anhydrase/acetyltransferase-like protein (isoleucine patch superfamily)
MTDHIAQQPSVGRAVFVHPKAEVIADVHCGDDVSIWPFAVVRGDVHHIHIGARSNIQDHSVLHTTHDGPHNPGGHPLTIGSDVTIGHRVTLHGCTLENQCFIGMGSTILDGACIASGAYLGANCLVGPGKHLAGGYLYLGQPAKAVRPLTADEQAFILYSAQSYVHLKNKYLNQLPHTLP